MYNKVARYCYIVLFILATAYFLYTKEYEIAAIAFFFVGCVIWSHFKHSSVLEASKHFKNSDYDRAEKFLNEVDKPELLAKSRRGFYEFMRANIALKKEAFEVAEHHFQLASRFPLGGANDRAFVLIHLANLALRKKDGNKALVYAEKAKELATSTRAIEIIKVIEKEAIALAN
jgi:hypothetical protein